MNLALTAALIMAIFAGAARAQPQSLAAYMALPQHAPSARIAYGKQASQVVELFLPPGKGPHPVVILLHGGCWRREFEGLRQTSGVAADLAAQGVAVWNIDYRGVDETGGGYPGTFQDVAAAVDLIGADARLYDLDATKVVAVGHSAGGHLALWAAARPRLPRGSVLYAAHPLPISTVLSLGGVGDLQGQEGVAKASCGFARDALLGQRPSPFADTSPAELLPAGTKVIMIHGALDPIFPPDTGRAYVARATASGDPAEFMAIPGAGHFDTVMTGTAAWRLVSARVLGEIRALR